MTEAGASRLGDHVACSDCERIHPSLIAQPVNTVSSLAYCAGGAWILTHGSGSRSRLALGIGAIAAGLGSVAYHGPGGQSSQRLHDVSAGTLAAATTIALARPARSMWRRLAAVGCLAAAVAVHTTSRTDRVLCRPDSIWQGHALWHVLGALGVVLAAEDPDVAAIKK